MQNHLFHNNICLHLLLLADMSFFFYAFILQLEGLAFL